MWCTISRRRPGLVSLNDLDHHLRSVSAPKSPASQLFKVIDELLGRRELARMTEVDELHPRDRGWTRPDHGSGSRYSYLVL